MIGMLALLLLLTSCAGQRVWVPPKNTPQSTITRDRAECIEQEDFWSRVVEDRVGACLTARGYHVATWEK